MRADTSTTTDPGWLSAQLTTSPDTVQVIYENTDGSIDVCAGALIGTNEAATTATCLAGRTYAGNADALVMQGAPENIVQALADSDGQDDYALASTVVHQWVDPNYASTSDNDVAVLTLEAPLAVSPVVTGVPFAASSDTSDYQAGTSATVYGWSTNPGADFQSATLPIADDTTCAAAITGYVTGDNACAGDGSTTPAACPDAEGDPLFNTSGTLIGLETLPPGTSGCGVAGSYQLFTKLATYAGPLNDWANTNSVIGANSQTNGLASMWASNSSGDLYEYSSTGTGTLNASYEWDSNADMAGDTILQTDLERSGYTGLLYRNNSTGELYYHGINPTTGTWATTDIGGGWNEYTTLIAPGNVGGAQAPDLMGIDSSGDLWLYLGYGDGTFTARTQIGNGWNIYNLVIGGDFNGDGNPDLIARDTSGNLYFYAGTGNWHSPLLSRVQIGTDYQIYTNMTVVPTFTNNGLAGLIGEDTSGNLWAYTATSTPTIISARTQIGYGYQIYNALF
jgi:hypothetical protein